MAVNKVINTTNFTIEVENGTDKTGNKIYKKKSFPNVKTTATPQNIYDVADAIKAVLGSSTRDYFINEGSKLVNA